MQPALAQGTSGVSTAPRELLVDVGDGPAVRAWEAPGPPGAPALLLLHGWTATAALNWYGALPYLGRQFRALAPNLPGHGSGGPRDRPFSLDRCADELARLMVQADLVGAVVVGYSMGGAVAQVLARRHPELLGGAVMCATAAEFASLTWLRPAVRVTARAWSSALRRWPGAAQQLLAWRLGRHDAATARAARRQGEQAPGPADRAAGAAAAPRPMTWLRPVPHPQWALDERAEAQLAALVEAGAELNAYDSSSWLPGLGVRSAVVVTTRDTVVAPARQEALVRLLPGAARFEVAAGHDAVVSRLDLFLPVLAEACRCAACPVAYP